MDLVDELVAEYRGLAPAGAFPEATAWALIRACYGKGYVAGLAEVSPDPQVAALEVRKAMARLP